MLNSKSKILLFLVIGLLSIFPLFNDLDKRPIEMWDEANYANNSIDMLQHPNAIVTSTEGIPETYNTKPPLAIWIQAISYKFFGINEFALRFPSALFGLFTILLLLWFCVFVLNNTLLGFITSLVLITTKGFISIHCTRTGDLDVYLVFFETLYALFFLRFLLLKNYRTREIVIITSGIILAFLSKGMAGFFLIPFLIIISLFGGIWKMILFDKRWYWAAFSVISVILVYYSVREILQPGFFKVVYREEIGRFYSDHYSWLNEPFNYYILNMLDYRYKPFVYLIPFTPLIFYFNKSLLERRALLFSLILSLGYLLLISSSKTKVAWYDLPAYPFLAMVNGLLVYSFIHFFLSKIKFSDTIKHFVFCASITILFTLPYIQTVKASNYSGDSSSMYDMMKEGAYMRTLISKKSEIKVYTVLKKVQDKSEHYDQIKFYQRTYNLTKGYNIKVGDSLDLHSGETILTCQKEFIDSIEGSHAYTMLDSCTGCKLYRPK